MSEIEPVPYYDNYVAVDNAANEVRVDGEVVALEPVAAE